MIDSGILRHIWDGPHVEEVELLKVGCGFPKSKKEVGTKCDIRKTVDWESETKVQIESSAQRVPEPDPLLGISFDARPDPFQF